MRKIACLLGLIGVGFAATAYAQVGVTGSIGTTGIGAHATIPVMEKLNARVGVNLYHYSDNDTGSNLAYNYRVKLKTFDALLDYYPTRTGFRLTGGLTLNGNKVEGSAVSTAGGTYTINGTTYNAASAGTVNGEIDFRTVAPYLGIGWGNAIAKDKGWSFAADLGVLFHGTPRTSLTNTGCTAPAAICTQLAADLARENAQLNNDADDFKFYPVARVGLAYRF